ncbi:MAG: Yip1 family protein [Candidatus Micrarchaeota archaeon]|nr:Yip1 family protein [Candidatus Micrarchaeota archaeon]
MAKSNERKPSEKSGSPEGSITDSIKDLVRKYFSLIPFIRKKELAELVTDPNAAIAKEIETTSVKRGYLDLVVPHYISCGVYIALMLSLYAVLFLGLYLFSSSSRDSMNAFVSALDLAVITSFLASFAIGFAIIVAIVLIMDFLILIFSTAVFFISAKIFGGKGGFWKMLSVIGSITGAVMILQLPFLILTMLPCVGYLFAFTFAVGIMYLVYKLNIRLHGMDPKNAALSAILPFIFFILLGIVLFVAYILFFVYYH